MTAPPPGHIAARFDDEADRINKLSEIFKRRIDSTINGLRKRITVLLNEYAATGKGALDIEFALRAKTQLQQIMRDAGYYRNIDTALAQYGTLIDEVRKDYELFGVNVSFTEPNRRLINELIKTDVAEFQDIAKRVQTQIYQSLTDSVLGNVSIADGVNAVADALASSDLAKHAYTYMNTAYMNFNRRVNNIAVENTGWTEALYTGPLDGVTRPFCRKHVGQILTLDEIKKMQNDQGGNAFTECGGWSCRHRWVSIPPEYKDTEEYQAYSETVNAEKNVVENNNIKNKKNGISINEVYSTQSYRDEGIIKLKQNNKDYEVTISYIKDDGKDIPIIVDGHHSYEAAKRDGVSPKITIVKSEYKTVEDYVKAFNDMSNPEKLVGGENLW